MKHNKNCNPSSGCKYVPIQHPALVFKIWNFFYLGHRGEGRGPRHAISHSRVEWLNSVQKGSAQVKVKRALFTIENFGGNRPARYNHNWWSAVVRISIFQLTFHHSSFAEFPGETQRTYWNDDAPKSIILTCRNLRRYGQWSQSVP